MRGLFAWMVSACVVLGASAGSASRELSAEQESGREIYNVQCGICHAGNTITAPTLHGLIGRRVASIPHQHSPVFREADFIWTEEILDAYIEDPQGMMPGNWMAHYGIADPAERRALIAFIKVLAAGE